MRKLIDKELGVKATIKTARKLGIKTCIVELGSEENKREVMQNKSKLRNRRGGQIYINDDLTKEERDIQKKIRQRAMEERSKGKQAKIGYSKLIIDGQTWKWNRRDNILEQIGSVMNNPKN